MDEQVGRPEANADGSSAAAGGAGGGVESPAAGSGAQSMAVVPSALGDGVPSWQEPGAPRADRPEIYLPAAFAAGFLLARLLARIAGGRD